MVTPQMVLYLHAFYEQHKTEIDEAAEAWGYARSSRTVAVDGDERMIVFERIAT